MCKAEMQDGRIKLWTPIEEVESQALDQLKNIASLPWVFKHVAVMPDVHYGKGATVGSVIAMKDALAPAAVGVDIGCGMMAFKTGLNASDLPDSLAPLRSAIEAVIPVGFNSHDGNMILGRIADRLFEQFKNLTPKVADLEKRAWNQVGTLGGGNHFIELCLDENDHVWIMLHSGSRNIGKSLAEYHIGVARGLAHNAELPDRDLAVFLRGTPEMEAYRRDLMWAQDYARINREVMLSRILDEMDTFFPNQIYMGNVPIACHHNYVSEETHFGEEVLVTRKGAVYAGTGAYGIIPGSMGTRSYIVRGLGNPDSFNSCSHGAGRRMSRGEAKRRFSVDDLEKALEGIESRKDAGVLDEIPQAYKDIDVVMANQADLVEIVHTLKQVMVIKG